MAERRMFAKTIVMSDAFLDMPLGARCLYFTLGMVADDDGFVNSPKSVIRQCAATEDDLKILLAKKFVLAFQNGVVVIKHWKINNYIRSDRYVETKYQEQMAQLSLDENNAYRLGIPPGIPSIDKYSKGYKKENTKRKKVPDFKLSEPKGNDMDMIREQVFDGQ